MARLVSRSGRSRLPLLLGAFLVAVALLALGAFYLFPRPSRPPGAVPASTAAPSTPSSRAAATAAAEAPTGCLGGPERDAAMVLAAQQQASHTAFGAVEVAAAVFRWGLRYPYPTESEVRAVRPVLAPSSAAKQEAAWTRSYRGRYQPPAGEEVAAGTPYYVTTANGSWLTTADLTANRVNVQLETHPVIDDAYSTSTVTLEVDLQWIGGAWHVHNLAQANGQALANGGTTFTSGC